MRRQTGSSAIVSKRAKTAPVETAEIRGLAEAAGYEVTGEVTQTGPTDTGTYFGRGKIAELADLVSGSGAAAVVVDGQLTPTQSVALRESLPEGTEVFDRYRLVLRIFGDRAESRRARLQVELARLRYALPRLRERADVQNMSKLVEKGTPIDGVENQIADLERTIESLPSPAEQYRERRREQGFDLVTLAGYTNAGKSTLLHRLADDLDLAAVDPDHPDEDPTAAVADRLFETLETTTRRATLGGRPTLVTDTVGYVDDLPHWLVESFSETLSEASAADAVVLVVDASDDPGTMREKLQVSLDVLDAQGVDRESVVTAVNKMDLVAPDEREARLDAVDEIAPAPVPVSVTEGTNLAAVCAAVRERLPTESLDVTLPNCDEAMGLVSEAYDHLAVSDISYRADRVRIEANGRPAVVAKLEARVSDIRAVTGQNSEPRPAG
jgi:GTP-binding protein HflX